MRIAIEHNALSGGTAAVEVEGIRLVYLRPTGDGSIEITIVPYGPSGEIHPMGRARIKSNVAAALKRKASSRQVP